MKVRNVGVGRVWDCMMCTSVSEEGGDGEGESSETPSLLSYTLRYVSLTELVHECQFGFREAIHLHTPVCRCERGGWGRGGFGLRNDISVVIHTKIPLFLHSTVRYCDVVSTPPRLDIGFVNYLIRIIRVLL
jgi:hypothetical protein